MNDTTEHTQQTVIQGEQLQDLEALRLRMLGRRRTFWLVAAGVLVCGGLAGLLLGRLPLIVAGVVLAALVAVIGQSLCHGAYRKRFKQELVPRLLDSLAPGLRYSPTGHVSLEDFKRGSLYHSRADRFSGEDLIEGKIGDTQLCMSELHAQEKHVTHNGKTTQVRYVTFFKGLYMIADFHKHFSGKTLVLPDSAEKLFGGLLGRTLQKWNFTREQLVQMEDPEFEREFVVYSTDQVESRYLLSTAMLRRILELKQRSGCTLLLSFVDSEVHVALHGRPDMLEPGLGDSLIGSKGVERFLGELRECLGLVDALHLNTRIWSKAPGSAVPGGQV